MSADVSADASADALVTIILVFLRQQVPKPCFHGGGGLHHRLLSPGGGHVTQFFSFIFLLVGLK